MDIKGGPLTPVTPEDVTAGFIAPDGRTLLVKQREGGWGLLSLGSDRITEVMGLRTSDENILGWSADGRAVFAAEGMSVPARLERIDLATGTRTVIKEVAPPDRSGVTHVFVGSVIDDGRGYAYSYGRWNSTLFLIEGLLASK